MGKGYRLADLNMSYNFSQATSGILQMQNVGDYYRNDNSDELAVLGRQTKVGIRLKF